MLCRRRRGVAARRGFTRRDAGCAEAAVLSGGKTPRAHSRHIHYSCKRRAAPAHQCIFSHTHTHTDQELLIDRSRGLLSPLHPPPPPGRVASAGPMSELLNRHQSITLDIIVTNWGRAKPAPHEQKGSRVQTGTRGSPRGGFVQHFKGPIRGFHHCQGEGNERMQTGCSNSGIGSQRWQKYESIE